MTRLPARSAGRLLRRRGRALGEAATSSPPPGLADVRRTDRPVGRRRPGAAWGAPARVVLAEAGPGDGTLMSDMLRAARLAPGLPRRLRTLAGGDQRAAARPMPSGPLGAHAPRWAGALAELPRDAPDDPGRQRIARLPAGPPGGPRAAGLGGARGGGWTRAAIWRSERPSPAPRLHCGTVGPRRSQTPSLAVIEVSPAQEAFAGEVGARIAARGRRGAADRLRPRSAGAAATHCRRFAGHRKVEPLETPGEADLTVHADFPAVRGAGRGAAGVAHPDPGRVSPASGPGRAEPALARGEAGQAGKTCRQLARLIGPTRWASLFKVVALHRRARRRRASRTADDHRRSCDRRCWRRSRRAARLLHPPRRGFDRGLRQPEPRARLQGRSRGGGREPAPAPRRSSGVAPEALNDCLPDPFGHGGRRRDALGDARPRRTRSSRAAPGLVCGALAADCAPVLIAEPRRGWWPPPTPAGAGRCSGVIEARR